MSATPILLAVRHPEQGGCERDLARVALHIDRKLWEPHVCCFVDEGIRVDELRAAGIPILRLPMQSFMSPASQISTLRALRAYVKEHGIRLLHAWDNPTVIGLSPLARVIRIPALITSQLSFRHLVPRAAQRMLRVGDRLAHRIIVNSKAVLEDMVRNEGVPRPKLVLSYNGLDTSVYKPGARFAPPSLRGASLVIGSVAALRPEKQLHLLAEAFARVAHLRPDAKLLIVGGGAEEARIRATAESTGVARSLVLAGTQSNVHDWLRAIDIFVLPSRSESFPNTVLEAMASGCCTVASNVGGIPELVEHNVSGVLFPPADVDALASELAALIQNPDKAQKLAAAAVARAHSEFTIERFVRRTESIYAEVLDGRR